MSDARREALRVLEVWRGEATGWVRARVLALARRNGEYHADMMVGVRLGPPRTLDVVTDHLARQGLIEKLNAAGEREHRPTRNRSKAWVWRLTPEGHVMGDALHEKIGDKLPVGDPLNATALREEAVALDPPGMAFELLRAMSYGHKVQVTLFGGDVIEGHVTRQIDQRSLRRSNEPVTAAYEVDGKLIEVRRCRMVTAL